MKTVMMNRKRMVSIFFMLIMTLGLFMATPATVFAADHQVSDATELAAAFAAADDGDTITLTADITYNGNIMLPVSIGTLTINLNSFTLNADRIIMGDTAPAGTLVVQGPGIMNVSSSGSDAAIAVEGSYYTSILSMTDGAIINAVGQVTASFDSIITVANVTATGNTIDGVRGHYGSYGFSGRPMITVTGDINVSGNNSRGIYLRTGIADIGGNITVTGANGIGVSAEGSKVTVDGTITAQNYIQFSDSGGTPYYRAPEDFVDPSDPRNKPGYLMYMSNDGLSFVWVKAQAPPPTKFTTLQHFGNFKGSGDLTGKTDGLFGNFKELLLNGKTVDPSNYSVGEGSTIITLFESYLLTHSDGTHNFRAVFTDGYADFILTVNAQSTAQLASSQNGVPQTGDSNAIWPIILLLIVVVGFGALFIARRKLIKH